MKETIEQAAREYAEGLRSVDKKNTYDNIEVDSSRMVAFKRGAEWQANQSPWISVEERLPEKDGLRVWVKSSCLNNQPLVYHKGKFYARLSDGTYDGSITHWMYIPE